MKKSVALLKKFVALLTKKKGKMAMNEWGSNESDIFQTLCKIRI